MRIAIYGTTHSGRKELVDNLVAMFPDSKVDVIHVNDLRNDYHLHCPWCGFDTEVEPWNEDKFHGIVLDHVSECEDGGADVVIIEGEAMRPLTTAEWLEPDVQVLMARTDVSPEEMLAEARKTDDASIYTSAKADTYLLRYFATQQSIASKWIGECQGGTDIIIADAHDISDSVKAATEAVASVIA